MVKVVFSPEIAAFNLSDKAAAYVQPNGDVFLREPGLGSHLFDAIDYKFID